MHNKTKPQLLPYTPLMKTKSIVLLLSAACLLALPQRLFAQNHYPAGVEGIKAGSLPPPGFYLRDYNYFYFSDKLKGGPPNFDLFAYVQAPRAIWITDFKILGGYYGMDVLVPFVYTDLRAGGFENDSFGLGDIHVEPITLSWHVGQFDAAVGYAFWAPTGDFDAKRPDRPGKGFWSHMLTAGGTWYVDKEKTWAASILNRYEFHTEIEDTPITPGNTWTLEWGLSKSITKIIDVGVVGYYQKQTTEDDGPGASNVREHVVALGPEISAFCPRLGLFTSLRYLKEFEAKDRPEGHTVALTLTKRW